eukprot:2757647-Prymnesium_polylepis.2
MVLAACHAGGTRAWYAGTRGWRSATCEVRVGLRSETSCETCEWTLDAEWRLLLRPAADVASGRRVDRRDTR